MSVLRRRSSLFARGEPLVWLTGAALVLCIFMIVGLLALVIYNGSVTFWPKPVTEIETVAGARFMGELTETEEYEVPKHVREGLPEGKQAELAARGNKAVRRLYRTGNFRLTNTHFTWVSDFEVKEESEPEWGVLLERMQWGRFYGFPKEFRVDGKAAATGPAAVWGEFEKHHGSVRERWEEQRDLETDEVGEVNARDKEAQLDLKEVELDYGKDSPQWRAQKQEYDEVKDECDAEWARIRREIDALKTENARYELVLATADERERVVPLADIVRAYPPNQLSWGAKAGVYASRWWEFLWDDPREANQEGGVYPAIFGTVVMTLIMSILVVPFGVLAALYLREYARQGVLVSIVRIAVNNLAGVPSIVFGVFGLGFFCYIVGVRIDEWFFAAEWAQRTPTFGKGGILWASLTLALLTLPVVIVATEESLAAVPNSMREGSYACGASKWQTIRNIVLPRAMPGIMTGMVLAIARGAGEVAPLMLVGAMKQAPALPVDGTFPFIHPQRSFMHLGFHIYDLGFQSPNSEAAKPMVFTTTLLLILIVVALNVLAIRVRARLRRKFDAG